MSVIESCSNCRHFDKTCFDEPCSGCKGCYLPDNPTINEKPWLWEPATNRIIDHDSVEHPSHYNCGTIEVWDFIADWKLNFDRGNAIKYICRAGSKDPSKEIQDLEKAIQYINHEIKVLKGEE